MSGAPLAERARPGDASGFIGQERLAGRLKALQGGARLPNVLLFGPPGCGKSTLAILLAKSSGKSFVRVSAPEAGLARLRSLLGGAELLILDELHRFSKAQQDFFLPLLESGRLSMIATTTENPSFCVTRQLLSRMQVWRLSPLSLADLAILGRRGADLLGSGISDASLRLLAERAAGDGRAMLNLVEYAAGLSEKDQEPQRLAALLPEAVARHDRAGDNHYELASALIKSIRGSDPDAALYYLARLLEGGEDPRFVCRRLILSASEDIGLADPGALPMAVACQQAVEFCGMPEAVIPLAETTAYLALAKKSNSAYAAYLAAQREVKRSGALPVPFHLRNASTQLQKSWGFGRDYKYPHDWPESWVEQAYLPEDLSGARFYRPRGNGAEPDLTRWWRGLRKAAEGADEA